MTKHPEALAPPRDRDDLVLVRGARGGTYWQAPDGLVVRIAASESEQEAHAAAHEILTLACRDAQAQ